MKELILFVFVILFIACQNQPLPETTAEVQNPTSAQATAPAAAVTSRTTSSLDSMACGSDSPEMMDLAKDIQDPAQPGIHYRAAVLRSEASAANQAELVCVSNVTSETDEAPAAATEITQAAVIDDSENMSWEILTTKWEYVKKTEACVDFNAQAENPVCQEVGFVAEEGKYASSSFPESTAL